MIGVKFPALDEGMIACHVLDKTPAVVSVGKLCLNRNYGFYWPPKCKRPYFETPSGQRIYMNVRDFIPYFGTALIII